MGSDESMWTRSDEAWGDPAEAIRVHQWLRGGASVRQPPRAPAVETAVYTRPSVAALTDTQKRRYIRAFTKLNTSGWLAPYIEIHNRFMMSMHGTMPGMPAARRRAAILQFLPWHRLYVLNFERQMRSADQAEALRLNEVVSDDFAVPYWPWRTYRAFPGLLDATMRRWLFDFHPDIVDSTGATVRTVRRDEPTILATPGPSTLPTASEVTNAMIAAGNLIHFVDPNLAVPGGGFSEALEWLHNNVHIWIGGTMAAVPIAPSDPVFWMHHAEIDRIWRTWTVMPFVGDAALRAPAMGGADFVLPGLTGPAGGAARSNDVLDVTSLGYDYDTLA